MFSEVLSQSTTERNNEPYYKIGMSFLCNGGINTIETYIEDEGNRLYSGPRMERGDKIGEIIETTWEASEQTLKNSYISELEPQLVLGMLEKWRKTDPRKPWETTYLEI